MTLGIIGAMIEEITPLLELFGDYKGRQVGGNTYYEIQRGEHKIFVAYSKIGKVHSALTSSTMILHFGCEKIIFSGVAGGLSADLKVGDLILGQKLCQYDVDISAFGHPLGFIPESKIFIESDATLNSIAREIAKKQGIKLKEGTIASGDAFIADSQKKQWIIQHFGADAVEMEGASVAVVCDLLAVPFCILRSISDSADGNADVSFDEFLVSSAKRSADFVMMMCEMILAHK
ncbi:5'-methylthioadenosine/adenosylhomocysteine nucleosidase [Helicobacter hepaticus]|jgi:adenosylhomocysteine/aminodeoxyfutalosine nucleosidase|uniref:adenosylhomocysteine nucleosidase n=1 Tax=Helicobacter hepaticus (strain ATCC 51449 / 3B1) TaxID=235279 RepID=Q7VGN7_HELHP|nr:5'-methylthioadenosine/adenosylhomocysteine nucleosidase [Helicobacter hepaticus]AAP77880.1 S-adenosylhomocysteine nucleosidase [Helicobacter hepaticus ATCC 51449]